MENIKKVNNLNLAEINISMPNTLFRISGNFDTNKQISHKQLTIYSSEINKNTDKSFPGDILQKNSTFYPNYSNNCLNLYHVEVDLTTISEFSLNNLNFPHDFAQFVGYREKK